MSRRPLGRNQLGVLHALANSKHWYGGGFGCGWNWGTPRETQRLMDSLVTRGLAFTTQQGETLVYRVTDLGRAWVKAQGSR